MTIFKRANCKLFQTLGAMITAAVLAVCAMPITASATVMERPPEVPDSEWKDKIPASYQGDGSMRPEAEDFTWVYDVTNTFAVPAGATELTTPYEVSGNWKVFLVGEPTDAMCFYNYFNANIIDGGANNVTLVANWFKQTLVDRQTGESGILDSSGLKSEMYVGTMTNGDIFVEDPENDMLNRFMFANGSFINEFLLTSFYQIDDRQYGLGVFATDGSKPLGNVYMTRRVATSVGSTATTGNTTGTTFTTDSIISSGDENKTVGISFNDWSYFEGYWFNEYNDGKTVQRDSFYVQPIDPLSAYVVIADETHGDRMGVKAQVTYDSTNDKIKFLYPDGSVFDVMYKTDFYGYDAVNVEGFGGMMLRGNKADHAQEYWNYIADRFKGADVWYD